MVPCPMAPEGTNAVTIKLTFRPREHPDEDVFEKYVFNRLSEKETADFEEHLLVCEKCNITLEQTQEYIRLMKAGTAAYLTEHKGTLATRFGERGFRWNAAAACAILLTCLTAVLSWRSPPAAPQAIVLDAYRGATSEAPAGQPLDLQIDLKDLPQAASYRVEVVNADGRRVWFGGTPARLSKGLPPGVYWVRLSNDKGELLREYGMSAVKAR